MFVSKQIITFLMAVCITLASGQAEDAANQASSNPLVINDGDDAGTVSEESKVEQTVSAVSIDKPEANVDPLVINDGDDAGTVSEESKVEQTVSAVSIDKPEANVDESLAKVEQTVPTVSTSEPEAKIDQSLAKVEHKVEENELDIKMLNSTAVHEVATIREYTDKTQADSVEAATLSRYEDLADRYRVKTQEPKIVRTFYKMDASKMDAPQLSAQFQWQCNWVCFIVGSIIVFTVWYTQGAQAPTQWNLDAILNQELRGVQIPGVGNPVSERKRLSSNFKENDCL